MNTRTKTIIGACVAAACAASFFIGRITAMDSVAEAEVELIARGVRLKLKEEAVEALLIKSRRLTEQVATKAAEAEGDLLQHKREQERSVQDLKEIQQLINSFQSAKYVPISAPRPVAQPANDTKPQRWLPGAFATIKAQIRQAAESKWPQNYTMVEYEIKSQSESYDTLNDLNRRANPATRDIIDRAAEKWPRNYTMIMHEVEREIEAYNRLHGR